MNMEMIKIQNNLVKEISREIESENFFERNKNIFALILIIISLFLLGIQLMPYIYGGSLGHFHSSGACGWPQDCGKVNSYGVF